jgi:ABC-type multidrug transport system fused ATPase/permease subunit
MSGELRFSFARYTIFILCSGQRIVARLRERTYAATLRQEVEFVERGEGDALSRLSVDSSIVGERLTTYWLIFDCWFNDWLMMPKVSPRICQMASAL